ncbi:MAG: hypothetical protein RIE53_02405 [Rhodothermales bacterium]
MIVALMAFVVVVAKIVYTGDGRIGDDAGEDWVTLLNQEIGIPSLASNSQADYLVYYIIVPSSCTGCLLEIEQFDSLLNKFDFGSITVSSKAVIVVDSTLRNAERFIRISGIKVDTHALTYSELVEEFKLPIADVGPRRMMIIDIKSGRLIWNNELRANSVSPLDLKIEFAERLRSKLEA